MERRAASPHPPRRLAPRSLLAALGLSVAASAGACGAEPPLAADDAGADAPLGEASPPASTSPPPTPTPDAGPDAADDASPLDAAPDAPVPDAPVPVDLCATAPRPACPTLPAGLAEGSGLRALERCAFPMAPAPGFGANGALITALAALAPKVTVADVLADANRIATRTTSVPGSPPGVAYALRWNAEDVASTDWIPQGLTGTPDADASGLVAGKRAILVSFYEDAGLQKGVRVAFVDVTDPDAPRYRFALLVEPTGTAAAPSFKQVDIHAGGIVWYGDKLYVAHTGTGFRVFDLARILQVAVDQDTVGCAAGTCRAGLYKYVVPQIGVYEDRSTCAPIFSWVSLDRTSSPPSLVSGEYCSGSACASALSGRVFRWPLDPATGLLRGATTWPTEAAWMSHKQVQGGAARSGLFYLSSSAPAAGAGELYRAASGKSATSRWVSSPEDLMVDGPRGWLWGLSEAPGARVVFAATLASYPAPP